MDDDKHWQARIDDLERTLADMEQDLTGFRLIAGITVAAVLILCWQAL